MRTNFYKRVLPLALIASMAIGSTGLAEVVSAQTTAPAAVSVMEDNDAAEVGAAVPAGYSAKLQSGNGADKRTGITTSSLQIANRNSDGAIDGVVDKKLDYFDPALTASDLIDFTIRFTLTNKDASAANAYLLKTEDFKFNDGTNDVSGVQVTGIKFVSTNDTTHQDTIEIVGTIAGDKLTASNTTYSMVINDGKDGDAKDVSFANALKFKFTRTALGNETPAGKGVTLCDSTGAAKADGTHIKYTGNVDKIDTATAKSATNAEFITGIAEGGFKGNSSITEMTFGAEITTIGKEAFKDCKSLEKITFTNATELASIGESAFEGCTSLKTVIVSDGAGAATLSIGKNAFKGCTELVAKKTGVTSGDGDFGTALAKLTNLNSIGENAFEGCSGLEKLDLSDADQRLTTIGAGAFKNCEALETLTLGNTDNTKLANIGASAFEGTAITDLTVGGKAFGEPQSSATKAVAGAFNDSKIEKLKIDKAEYLEADLFKGNTNLKEVDLTGCVKDGSSITIGDNIFNGTQIQYIKVPGADWAEHIPAGSAVDTGKFKASAFKDSKNLVILTDADVTKGYSESGCQEFVEMLPADVSYIQAIGSGAAEVVREQADVIRLDARNGNVIINNKEYKLTFEDALVTDSSGSPVEFAVKYSNNAMQSIDKAKSNDTLSATLKHETVKWKDFLGKVTSGNTGADYKWDEGTVKLSNKTEYTEIDWADPAVLYDWAGKIGATTSDSTWFGIMKESERSNISWALNMPNTNKASSAAKFQDAKGRFSAAKMSGKDIYFIGGLKASGKLNGVAELIGTDSNGNVVAKHNIYVAPTPVKELVVDTSKATKTGKYELKQDSKDDPHGYTLNIYEGQTFQLPIKAKTDKNYKPAETGLEYTLVGDTDAGFNVVNGKVTALAAGGSGTIRVKAIDSAQEIDEDNDQPVDTAYVDIAVNVLNNVSSLRANTTSLTVVPGDANGQRFTLSGSKNSNSQAEVTFDLSGATGYKVRRYVESGTHTSTGSPCKFTGAEEFIVTCNANADAKGKIKITYKPTTGTKEKTITINVAKADVFENVKSIKQSGKAKNGTIDLYVPTGVFTNLGVAVQPNKANNQLKWTVSTGTDGTNYVRKGDAFKPITAGTYEVTFTTAIDTENGGRDASGKPVEQKSKYVIHAYNPGAGYTMGGDYEVAGGFLVSNTDKGQDKTIAGAQTITVEAPTISGAAGEDVTWTSSNAAGLYIEENSTNLELHLNVAGTYTITGVSNITKKKTSFKVVVGVKSDADVIAAYGEDYPTSGTPDEEHPVLQRKAQVVAGTAAGGNDGAGTALEICVGDKVQAYLDTYSMNGRVTDALDANGNGYDTGFAGKKVAFKGSGGITVNGKGLITGKSVTGDTDAVLTVTMDGVVRTLNVKVKSAVPEITAVRTKKTYCAVGEAIPVTTTGKNLKDTTVQWKYISVRTDGSTPVTTAADQPVDISSGFSAAGEYYVYPVYTAADTTTKSALKDANVELKPGVNCVRVCVASVALTSNLYTANTLAGSPDVVDVKALAGSDVTKCAKKNKTYKIPIFAKGSLEGIVFADFTDIEWTSSNVNIATVSAWNGTGKAGETTYISKKGDPTAPADSDARNDQKYSDLFGVVSVATKTATGKVTITGVSKNGGKKFTITLNVQ